MHPRAARSARTRSSFRLSSKLACVLLAAGESRRLGAPKQLVRRRGTPLIIHAIETAAVVMPVVVVLGAHALRLRALLRRRRPDVTIVENAHWSEGLASSLRAGLRAVSADTRAVLVLLVDQPAVDRAALRRLIAAWRRRPSVPAAARYGERAGVPAILPRATWRALAELHGDVGARAVLRAAPRVTLVEMPEAALDIDTPQDLERWR
jgi:molybdenum cofactor cytidylyltransferase